MNNEIKEILDYLSNDSKSFIICGVSYYKISDYKAKVLLDYITNLQQENERLKQPKIFIDTQDMEERYGEELYKDFLEKQVKDYKSRIEKAVEYIDSLWLDKDGLVLNIRERLHFILRGKDK